MEPITLSVGGWLLSKVGDNVFKHLTSNKYDEDKLNERFDKVCTSAIAKCQKEFDGDYHDGIKLLLTNEKAVSLFYEYLFKESVLSTESLEVISDFSTLPHDFLNKMFEIIKKECLDDAYLKKVFDNKKLLIAVKGLNTQIEEIKSQINISTTEIIKIREGLESYLNQNFDYHQFHKHYKSVALNSLSQLNFIGLGVDMTIKKGSRKKIQDVFIKPNFLVKKTGTFKTYAKKALRFSRKSVSKEIGYSQLFNQSQKMVVLGSPGSGKSMLIRNIICELLTKKENVFENKGIYRALPIRVELRKYLAFKKLAPSNNIMEYLVVLLKGEYYIHGITQELVKNIFENESLILFFDGLDEIFDSTDKFSIKLEIESLHKIFPNFNSLTTSRIIGYEEAKLNEDFSEISILAFNEKQISEYVHKWYEKEEDTDEDSKKKEIRDFIHKSKDLDKELVSNPLLLSLIVILYKNNLKLPESKLEIYQSCTKTLVDKWDASKELKINLDELILKKKEVILAALAYWQYEESTKSSQITHSRTKLKIAEILNIKLDGDLHEDCVAQAEAFLSYAEKRSIYFDNNFTHKTFLEYYASYYIYTNIEKKHRSDERNKLLLKYIENPFWYIVFELLFNFIDKDQPDNDIIDGVARMLLQKKESSIPFLLTVIPSLKNISDKCVNEIIEKAIHTILKLGKSTSRQSTGLKERIFECLNKLFSISKFETVILRIINELEFTDIDKSLYNLLLELYFFKTSYPDEKSVPPDVVKHIENYKQALKVDTLLFLEDLHSLNTFNLKDDFPGCVSFYNDYFGYDSIFSVSPMCKYAPMGFGTLMNWYLHWQFSNSNITSISSTFKNLNSDKRFFPAWLNFIFSTAMYPMEHAEVAKIPIPKSIDEALFIVSAVLNFPNIMGREIVVEDLENWLNRLPIEMSKIKTHLDEMKKIKPSERLDLFLKLRQLS